MLEASRPSFVAVIALLASNEVSLVFRSDHYLVLTRAQQIYHYSSRSLLVVFLLVFFGHISRNLLERIKLFVIYHITMINKP